MESQSEPTLCEAPAKQVVGAATQSSHTVRATTAAPAPAGARRALVWGAIVLISVAGFFAGWLIYQDRPLREMRAAVRDHRWIDGLRIALKYLGTHPDDAEAWKIAGHCYGAMGQFTAAEQCFGKAGDLDITELRLRADALIHLERTTQAVDVLRELLARGGKDPLVMQRLAIMEFQRGAHEEAFELIRQLRQMPDRAAAAWCIEATFHTALVHNEAAVACLEKALELNPAADQCGMPANTALWYMGTALQDIGRTQEAREFLKRSLKLSETADAYQSLGDAEEASGDLAAAENAWRRALELNPRHAESMFSLAKLALKQNRPEEAIEWLTLSRRSGKSGSSLETAFSRAYARLGRVELANEHANRAAQLHAEAEARSTEERIVSAYPRNLHSRLLRTRRAIDSGNLSEAAALVDDALRDHPDNPYLLQLQQALRESK